MLASMGVHGAPEAAAPHSGVAVRERLRSLTSASLSWTCFISSFSSLNCFLAASAVPVEPHPGSHCQIRQQPRQQPSRACCGSPHYSQHADGNPTSCSSWH